MDITKSIAELRQELECIEEAILVLTRLATSGGRRRGRPPRWMQEAKQRDAHGGRRRRAMSAKARKAQSERMREYWAARRAKAANLNGHRKK